MKDNPPDLHPCWKPDCDGFMHEHCSKLLLDHFSIPLEERPEVEERSNDTPVVFCTKTCYNKWLAEKKRLAKAAAKAASEVESKKRKVPWESDGTLAILMEWMTEEGNYSAYAGSNGNVSGKSKSQYHKDIALLIKSKVPESQREAKDVENKIVSLERQFREASDWANNTGQGVENPGEFKSAVLKRCPLYDELEPIMGERPNCRPLYTNEDDSDENENATSTNVNTQTTLDQSSKTPSRTVPVTGNTPSTLSSGSSAGSTKRLAAASVSVSKPAKKKGKQEVDEFISNLLGEDGTKEDFHSLRVREVTARELEARARSKEAKAVSRKANKETDILAIDETVKLLRARKQLLEEGHDQKTIDEFLPLPENRKKNHREGDEKNNKRDDDNDDSDTSIIS